MAEHERTGRQQLFTRLSRAIEEWENSPYYLQDDELFDLEGFLLDENAEDVKVELEEIYGTPLNRKFWSSFLAYQRLKRAREEIKAQEALQEEKRKRYLEALEEEKKAGQDRLKEWFYQQRRHRIRVIKGGRKDDPSES